MQEIDVQETLSEFLRGFGEQIVTFKGIACAVCMLLIDLCAFFIFIKCYSEKKFVSKKWRNRFNYAAIVDSDRVIPIQNSEILLGRHRSADIQFPDLSVSRYHAVLTFSDGKFVLDDLGSKSGTYVNGKKIRSAVIKFNDEIRMGKIVFSIKKIKDGENEQTKKQA